METLTVTEAAELLKAHPKTVQQLAKAGALPACKVGRSWVFVRQLLIDHLAAASLAHMQVKEPPPCPSTAARTPPTGGSSSRPFAASRSLYSKALGLPTSGKRKPSTTV